MCCEPQYFARDAQIVVIIFFTQDLISIILQENLNFKQIVAPSVATLEASSWGLNKKWRAKKRSSPLLRLFCIPSIHTSVATNARFEQHAPFVWMDGWWKWSNVVVNDKQLRNNKSCLKATFYNKLLTQKNTTIGGKTWQRDKHIVNRQQRWTRKQNEYITCSL